MSSFFLPFYKRYIAYTLSFIGLAALIASLYYFPDLLPYLAIPCLILITLVTIGTRDLLQTRHSVLRNYPLIGHIRFLLEEIRPELRQYFFEDDKNGLPYSRDRRALIYQRAKGDLDKRPFGTQYDTYKPRYEWLNHSLAPQPVSQEPFTTRIGGPDCKRPYDASILNVSGMSYGALSPNAILALNRGARHGGFAQNTGEGGVSPYHLRYGGDLIWQIGTGYFGCRKRDGTFDTEKFKATATIDQVKLIEIKLSQGAKPGHGGILPKEKITKEIAEVRGVQQDQDCISPPYHSAFSTPIEMMHFIKQLRSLSGGKPIGFKLCIGHPWEFLSLCKAMIETGITPDFITIDGAEGGTGAAPLEFTDHIGTPLREALAYAHNALVGAGLRANIKLAASGKIASAFDIARTMALGADYCNAARTFMFTIGCIQGQTCHTGDCPTGITTQDPARTRALVVENKYKRVSKFHATTMQALAEVIAAAGLTHPHQIHRQHLCRRISENKVATYQDLFPPIEDGALLTGSDDPRFKTAWEQATASSFAPNF